MTKYAYCRVSTDEQGVSGIGLEHQRRVTKRMGDLIDDTWGSDFFPDSCTSPGYFVDVVSAYRIPFEDRPAGKALLSILDPGDTILISRLDRGFRSVSDFSNFIKLAQKNDWNFICEDPQIDLGTPIGRMTAKMYVLMSEWYSDMIGTRVKEALAAKKNAKLAAVRRDECLLEHIVSDESEYRPPVRITLPPDLKAERAGRIFVYIRCSHRSSAESGLGLRHQMTKCCSYADMLAERCPTMEWGQVIYTDPAVSSLSTALKKRPQGLKMDKELRAGDVVVCLRPDRIFGSISDMSDTLVEWRKRGVDLQFADGGFSMDTVSGQMFLNVMVSFSQFERQLASNRAKETYAVMASQGKFTGGRCGSYPPFYREYFTTDPKTNKKKRRLIIDRKQMVAFRYLLIMSARIGQRDALVKLEEMIAKRENRRPIPASGAKKTGPWHNLPSHYVANRNGYVFPVWTRVKFYNAKKLWDGIQQEWANKIAEDKEALRTLANQTGFRRHLAPSRKHSQRHWDNQPDPLATVATGS